MFWVVVGVVWGSVVSAQAQDRFAPAFGHASDWGINVKDIPDTLYVSTLDAGDGLAQVVANRSAYFVASGNRTPDPNDARGNVFASIVAYDLKTNQTLWKRTFDSKMHQKQESFGAAGPSAQSTPLLINHSIVHATFTGQLVCLDADSGKTIWEKDLVNELGATPVQFGFSSSPVAVPGESDQFVMLAAGPDAGLFQIDAKTGDVIWKAASLTFSYATPVAATLAGTPQWIVVSRDDVVGVDRSDGKVLWRHPLAEKGLTNVPTPLVIDDQHVLISGQGVKGTRCLEITNAGKWSVKPIWYQRQLQFFYTNWFKLDQRIVLACTDKYLAAFDAKTGQILGRFRGFADGNLVRTANQEILLLDGKGNVSLLEIEKGEQQIQSLQLKRSYVSGITPKGRYWTPFTLAGDMLATRSQDTLVLFHFAAGEGRVKLASTAGNGKQFEFAKLTDNKQATIGPSSFDRILSAFQTDGPEAAFALYAKLRSDGKLTIEDRVQLVQTARSEGMDEHADQILSDALEDFPDSVELKQLRGK